jgi:uncharacterized membrane protein
MLRLIEVANAQSNTNVLLKNPTVSRLLENIATNIVSPIIGIMFLLSFVVFVYSMFNMIRSDSDSEGRENGKRSILWSSIGMVIMLSAYGIIRLIVNTLEPIGVTDPFL